MKTAIGAFLGCIALVAVWSAPARAQAEGREYTGAWNHEHRHTCSQASDYPWTRALAEQRHETGVASTKPCPDCVPAGVCTQKQGACQQGAVRQGACQQGAARQDACRQQEGCCPSGHALPQTLFQQNMKMIRGLRCAYCIPEQYADELLARCEQARRECGMHPAGRCFTCSPAPGCRGAGTLETIHEELMLLKHKCTPCDER